VRRALTGWLRLFRPVAEADSAAAAATWTSAEPIHFVVTRLAERAQLPGPLIPKMLVRQMMHLQRAEGIAKLAPVTGTEQDLSSPA